MDKNTAISKILKVSQTHANNGIGIGGTPSVMSQPHSFQPQLNQAIMAYRDHGNTEELVGIVRMMQTTNALSEAEANEIITALES